MKTHPLFACAVLGSASSVMAGVTTYSNRDSWEGAAGAPTVSVDFEGFVADQSFQVSPVAMDGFTLQQTSGVRDFRNIIDTPPFLFTDNNGTNHASMFVEGDEPVEATVTLDDPAKGWAAYFVGTDGGERVDLIVYLDDGSSDRVQLPDISTSSEQFFGVVAGARQKIVSIRFVARTAGGTVGGEGFTMDKVLASPASGGCYADCDGSGSLDFFDFLCFQNAFSAGDPYADCDQSGVLDFFDFLCYQNAFDAGCP